MLKLGDRNNNVKKWQIFLTGQGFYDGIVDGTFGNLTHESTINFQSHNNLVCDGIVGPNTIKIAIGLGYVSTVIIETNLKSLTYVERQRLFGPLSYISNPTKNNKEAIKITNSWTKNNLKNIEVPQLKGIKGAPSSCMISFHSKGSEKLVELWEKWEKNGLLHLILSWEGSWVPRFIRGSQTYLSSHAFATAFDINAKWNSLGVNPPAVGSYGSVRELVPIANELGFFWGGNWSNRPDGMHFELVKP